MLASLNDHGYVVEWRVLNAADFGFPQKRRRVFILAYLGNEERNLFGYQFEADKITKQSSFEIKGSLTTLSENFGKKEKVSKFLNAGVCIDRKISTQTLRYKSPKKPILLKEILIKKTSGIDEEFWVDEKDLSKWKKAKKGRSIKRTSMRDGKPFNYTFSEGDMSFPDKLDTPARTIITSEGGKSPARSKHIIKQKRLYLPKWLEDFLLEKRLLSNHKVYRRLTAIELERLNMFPDNHTKENDISNSKRAFFMGNALVVGIVEKIGFCIVENEKKNF
jgi:DNA (cytosine-5)-methyltransferase 1